MAILATLVGQAHLVSPVIRVHQVVAVGQAQAVSLVILASVAHLVSLVILAHQVSAVQAAGPAHPVKVAGLE